MLLIEPIWRAQWRDNKHRGAVRASAAPQKLKLGKMGRIVTLTLTRNSTNQQSRHVSSQSGIDRIIGRSERVAHHHPQGAAAIWH